MNYLKFFLIAFPVFLALDFLWLGLISNSFYLKEFGSLARRAGDSFSPNWIAALLSYFLIIVGITVFVMPKAGGSFQALLFGALFGVIVYGVYDLVNLAVIQEWSLKLTVVDILWGGTVCGITSLGARYIYKAFFN